MDIPKITGKINKKYGLFKKKLLIIIVCYKTNYEEWRKEDEHQKDLCLADGFRNDRFHAVCLR